MRVFKLAARSKEPSGLGGTFRFPGSAEESGRLPAGGDQPERRGATYAKLGEEETSRPEWS